MFISNVSVSFLLVIPHPDFVKCSAGRREPIRKTAESCSVDYLEANQSHAQPYEGYG